MTAEQISTVLLAQPFLPFTIHVADGRSFRVKHPDYVSRSPAGRIVIVYNDDGGDGFSILDLRLITELEVHPEPPDQEAA
ncbi:MAG: hypothetical protein AAGA57_04770 [Planctomycetota bacterium]